MLRCDLLFFQAEEGIGVHCVTGVQTCALRIADGTEQPHQKRTNHLLNLNNNRAHRDRRKDSACQRLVKLVKRTASSIQIQILIAHEYSTLSKRSPCA